MHLALLLIALGFGFKIFSEASSGGKKPINQLGRLIGVVIMALSFLSTVCMVSCIVKSGSAGPMGKRMCPITGEMMDWAQKK